MKLTEKAIEMANVWLKNIEIMINKRDEKLFWETCRDYALLLEFESASFNSSHLHMGENEKCPRMLELEVKKGKREVLGCRKRSL